jgi:5,10-methylenetetrahydromethanopterin reductase
MGEGSMVKMDTLLLQDLPKETLIAFAREVEDIGFGTLWFVDSQDVYYEAWVTAGVCAAHTERIRLGPGVTNPVTRHPRVTAAAAEALHHYSGGRAILGIGAGDSALRTMGLEPSLQSLREATESIRKRFEKKGLDIPIYLSCHGYRSTVYACRVADGIIVAGDGARPEELRRRLDRIESACIEVGRDFTSLPILSHHAIAISEDKDEAFAESRGSVAKAMRMILQYWNEWPKDLEAYRSEAEKLLEVYDYKHHMEPVGEHANLISDSMIETFGLAGTPSQVAKKLEALARETAGLDFTFLLRPDFGGRMRTLKFLTHDVMQKLRNSGIELELA